MGCCRSAPCCSVIGSSAKDGKPEHETGGKNHRADALEIVSIASAGRAASVWCVFFGWLSFERKLFQLSAVVSLSLSLPLFGSFCVFVLKLAMDLYGFSHCQIKSVSRLSVMHLHACISLPNAMGVDAFDETAAAGLHGSTTCCFLFVFLLCDLVRSMRKFLI